MAAVLSTSKLPADRMYERFIKAARQLGGEPFSSKVHHSYASTGPDWSAEISTALLLPRGASQFALQIQLEKHDQDSRSRVIIFGRRERPRSSATSRNTQRATFNSLNVNSQLGFWVRPQIGRKHPAQVRAFASLRPKMKGLPFWSGSRFVLGDGSSTTLLERFLSVLGIVEDVKGMAPTDLANQYPEAPSFSVADLRLVILISEGAKQKCTRTVRRRSELLRQLATEHFCNQSRDGKLHCEICNWFPWLKTDRAVVQLHHEEPISGYPDEGKALPFLEAIANLHPLCPNCHRLLEAKPEGGIYTVHELRQLRKTHLKSNGL